MTPVVGKALEIGVVVAYVSIVVTIVYGGVVPAAQSSGDAHHADAVLVRAADALDHAIPSTGVAPTVRYRVALPETIGGDGYRIHWTNDSLVLTHPDPAIGGRVPLPVPEAVNAVQGNLTGSGVVVVNTTATGWLVTLEEGDR